jgi:competence protein ComEC
MYRESPSSGVPVRAPGILPLFHAAWLFGCGIVLAQWVWLRPSLVLASIALVAVLCAIAALRAQRIAWLPLAALWCLLGVWCALMEPQPASAPALASLSDGLLRTVEGTVVDAGGVRVETESDVSAAPDSAEAFQPSQRIDVRVASVETVTDTEDLQSPMPGGVRLTVRWPENAGDENSISPLHCGDRIRAVARLAQPEIYHDAGVWSRAEYLLGQGITSTASVNADRVEVVGGKESTRTLLTCRIGELQHASTTRLLALPAAMRSLPAPLRLTQEDAIMIAAMVAGDRTYLNHALRVGFERTGSFHMLVVSGFHLAIVAGCIFWVARRLRLPRVPATFFTILASFAYALFTGFATPVERSLWMVTLYLLGRLIYRERSPLNTIGFASLCLMVVSPRSLLDSSLQMTLLAVVVIAGVAAPLLEKTVHPYLNATRDLHITAIDAKMAPLLAQFRGLLRFVAARIQEAGLGWVGWKFFPWSVRFALRLVEFVTVSLVVELAMTLPMATYFHRITIFALPVNLFILPLLTVLMPAALLTLVLLAVWPAAAVVPAMGVAVVLHGGVGLVHLFGSMEFGDFRIPNPPLPQSAAFYVLLGLAILLAHLSLSRSQRWQRRLAWVALLLAAGSAVVPRAIDRPHNALLVEAIDVGQGDSLLLITPDGKTMLVDGGGIGGGLRPTAQNFDVGEEVVSPALWARGIRHLDVVALTHAHSDHMGGLPAVLRNFHPDQLWVGNNPPVDDYNALLHEAEELHTRIRTLHAGDSVALGTSKIDVLAPRANYTPRAEPGNNDSMVLRVAYEATSVLLEGDAEAPVEDAMLGNPELKSTLLKVGHHGSMTSTRPEFLAQVAPQWAVISCGLHNRYGHPREETLKELQAAHVRTLRTDTGGASCFVLDGKIVEPDADCSR